MSAMAISKSVLLSEDDSGSSKAESVEDRDSPMQSKEVLELVHMGFDPGVAAVALQSADGNMEEALDILTGDAGEGDSQTPEAPLKGLQVIMSMGFSKEQATTALQRTGGDEAAAITLLVEPDSQPQEQRPAPRSQRATQTLQSRERERSRSRSPRLEARPPVDRRVQSTKRLTAFSDSAKQAVIEALGGPGGKRKSQVSKSIKRGRVSQWQHHWQKDPSEEQLETASPGYAKLKSYQRVGVRYLLALAKLGCGGILADEMGLGKTAQALVFLDLLPTILSDKQGRARQRPSLVVVPATVLENWERECALWCPHFRVFRYHASNRDDRAALAEDFEDQWQQGESAVVLTTAAILRNKEDQQHFFRKFRFECVLCDEAHAMKNAQTNAFRNVTRHIQAKRRILLTGTPVHNNLGELANLLKLLLQSEGGVSSPIIKELEQVVERQSLRTLQARAAPFMLRRLKRNVMSDLPPKTCQPLRCQMTASQESLYAEELKKAKEESKNVRRTKAAKSKFVKHLFARLRRLCNHPLLMQARLSEADFANLTKLMRTVREDFARASFEKCREFLKEMSDYELVQQVREYNLQGKLADFGIEPRKLSINRDDIMSSGKIQELCKILESQREASRKTLARGIRFVRVDGTTKINERQATVDSFQKEGSGVDVIISSLKAGGQGLNLTAADRDNRQAEDRAHRLGQTRPVTVTYMTCKGTVEEKVVKCNISKMQLDYEFGGQRSALEEAEARLDEEGRQGSGSSESEGEGEELEEPKGKSFEDEVCNEFAQELGL
eukprot:s1604_g19.t1